MRSHGGYKNCQGNETPRFSRGRSLPDCGSRALRSSVGADRSMVEQPRDKIRLSREGLMSQGGRSKESWAMQTGRLGFMFFPGAEL